MMKFAPLRLKFATLRLAVVMLGDRLSVAAIQRDRQETFTIDAENAGAALRAELDARGLAARKVAIGLARSAVTVKPIELPAVAGQTREMVKFELERHLPIPADDAAFDFVPLPTEAEPESAASEGKRVLIVAADRRVVDAALRFAGARWRECDAVWVSGDGAAAAALLDLGVPISDPPWTPRARRHLAEITEPRGAAELAVATASSRGIRPLDLIPSAIKPRRLTRQEMFTGGVLAATVLLALAALLVPGYRDSRSLGRLNAEIARIDPEVRAVERVARELERKRQLLVTLEKIGPGALQPLPVLRELTDVLPSDAWVTYLAFDAKGVELTGQAGAASTLIPLLENSPRLERVEFASPVTRGRDREQFRIRAAWETPAAAPPAPTVKAPATPGLGSPSTKGEGRSGEEPIAPARPGPPGGTPGPPRQ